MKLEPKKKPKQRRRLTPKRLPEKLKRIRLAHDLTQAKMLGIVNPFESDANRARVSQYEKGQRVPSLVEFYHYAKFAEIAMETLADDALDLPATIHRTTSRQDKGSKQSTEKMAKTTETAEMMITADSPESDSTFQSATDTSVDSAAICRMPISGEMLCQCKIIYLELLNELPFDKMSRLTPEKLIEQIFVVAFNDYLKRKMESELAYRVRQLVEDED